MRHLGSDYQEAHPLARRFTREHRMFGESIRQAVNTDTLKHIVSRGREVVGSLVARVVSLHDADVESAVPIEAPNSSGEVPYAV